MASDLSHRAAFEKKGETAVRVLAQQNDDVGRQAVAWLAEQQALRDEAAASRRDAREEETLAIARSARRDAKIANMIAVAAIICSAIAAYFSIVP